MCTSCPHKSQGSSTRSAATLAEETEDSETDVLNDWDDLINIDHGD